MQLRWFGLASIAFVALGQADNQLSIQTNLRQGKLHWDNKPCLQPVTGESSTHLCQMHLGVDFLVSRAWGRLMLCSVLNVGNDTFFHLHFAFGQSLSAFFTGEDLESEKQGSSSYPEKCQEEEPRRLATSTQCRSAVAPGRPNCAWVQTQL
eukprot:Skav207334  [mRNA]  locus=scaffold3027:308224:308800:- [translate_table: standard]